MQDHSSGTQRSHVPIYLVQNITEAVRTALIQMQPDNPAAIQGKNLASFVSHRLSPCE